MVQFWNRKITTSYIKSTSEILPVRRKDGKIITLYFQSFPSYRLPFARRRLAKGDAGKKQFELNSI